MIFIFTGREGRKYGYKDEWKGGRFHYTGKGQKGHMEMSSGNKAIMNHKKDGKELHVFTMVRSLWVRYEGQMQYERHYKAQSPDKHGKQRETFRFVLRPVGVFSGPDMQKIRAVEGILGYEFSDRTILRRALTREAYAKERGDEDEDREDQETLSTLGDGILKAILTEKLFSAGLESGEEITGRRRDFEMNPYLADIARGLGIQPFIIMNGGEDGRGEREDVGPLSDTLEAIIGALFLDAGYEMTSKLVSKWFPI